MRVLAIDTTSPRGSVAVAGPEGVLAEARLVTVEGHSRWLLPAAEMLLKGLGLDVGALDLFAVTTGPGSFTGLRVGLGSVQGLALASGRPCVGLPTLDVLAGAAAGASDTVVALVDAFRGEVYSGVFDGVGPSPPTARRRAAGRGACGTARGGGVRRGRGPRAPRGDPGSPFAAPCSRPRPISSRRRSPLAALRLAASGVTVPASGLRPLYLRGVDARPSPA